jgi:hypothetical protein
MARGRPAAHRQSKDTDTRDNIQMALVREQMNLTNGQQWQVAEGGEPYTAEVTIDFDDIELERLGYAHTLLAEGHEHLGSLIGLFVARHGQMPPYDVGRHWLAMSSVKDTSSNLAARSVFLRVAPAQIGMAGNIAAEYARWLRYALSWLLVELASARRR